MKKVKVGVIGVGSLGIHHARVYSFLENVDLVGVVDIDRNRAEEVAYKYSTKAYTNYQDLFRKVDAVSIVVPTTLHFSIALDFIENGINVLIEKPVTFLLEEARELVYAAKNNKVTLQVGHIERFNSAILALNDIIKAPLFIESHRLGPFYPRVSDVGVVLDLMIHDIDIITSITGYNIDRLEAFGASVFTDKEDIASAHIAFSNGVIANITASRVSQSKIRKLEITEINRYIYLDYITQEILIYSNSPSKNNGGNIHRVDVKKEEPLKLELKHFLNCVKNGEKPIVGIREGMNALDISLRILDQIKSNSPVLSL